MSWNCIIYYEFSKFKFGVFLDLPNVVVVELILDQVDVVKLLLLFCLYVEVVSIFIEFAIVVCCLSVIAEEIGLLVLCFVVKDKMVVVSQLIIFRVDRVN